MKDILEYVMMIESELDQLGLANPSIASQQDTTGPSIGKDLFPHVFQMLQFFLSSIQQPDRAAGTIQVQFLHGTADMKRATLPPELWGTLFAL